jgi:2-polyprenyl-6-methoxyphenol hydroxylase-like FAD-dependent oxidoreductase
MSRILIAGGSLGGLLAANMLLRDGHDVLVLEKATGSLDGRGAGIVTHAALNRGLLRAGATVDDTLGVRVESRVALDATGEAVARIAMPQVLTSWSRLYALLSDALPADRYRAGMCAVRVDQHVSGVRVHAESGEVIEGELLIASDGIRSAVRAQFAPQAVPAYAGYIAWRGVCDEVLLSRRTLSSVFDHFGFCLPAGEQLIGYPVAGQGNTTARGRRRYNFVWYRPANDHRVLRELLTDADGEHHPLGIPPNKVSWRHVAAMREAGRLLLAPQFAEILEKTAQPFLQPIYDMTSKRLAFDRVALMGDAAFVARPHIGMGVTKAAQDACALSDCLRQHGVTPAALRAYETMRLAPGQAAVQRGRDLGAYLQAQHAGTGDTVPRDADEVLRDTAVDLDVPASAATAGRHQSATASFPISIH